jgi:UPF0755 protein
MALKPKTLFFSVIILVVAILLATSFWWQSFVNTAVTPSEAQVIQIKQGSSFSRVAHQLHDAGIISDTERFKLLARLRKATGQIHTGEYLFDKAATPDQVLARLTSGDIRKFQFTIPEGFNLKEIAARVEKTGVSTSDEFLALCSDKDILAEFKIEGATLEGFLFPETYTYTSSTTAQELIRSMVTQMEDQLTPELLDSAKELNLNRFELITLASIIQKEAGNVMEMPLISAVFNNRLRKGIALQADPTVIYGVPNFDGNLTRKHLKTPTPYNTYRMRGLPAGPIASPGQFALHAAANPADSKDLYFVARGDGTHEFNTTLKAHNKAVRRYQLKR